MAVAAAAGVAAAAVVVAEEMANAKQTVEVEAKTQQSTIKKQKMAAETTAEVVWRPSAEDGNVAMVAVAAKATLDGGGVVGWRGGRGDRSDSRRRVQQSSSDIIDDYRSTGTGKSWSNTKYQPEQ
jgi:hypothetical protein